MSSGSEVRRAPISVRVLEDTHRKLRMLSARLELPIYAIVEAMTDLKYQRYFPEEAQNAQGRRHRNTRKQRDR